MLSVTRTTATAEDVQDYAPGEASEGASSPEWEGWTGPTCEVAGPASADGRGCKRPENVLSSPGQ
jgi:hypothetical protein